jgi:hypothetical protein
MERSEAAALLGITDDASERQLRTAYRRRIRERHPDRAGPAATVDAARIIEAYRVLSDPDATTGPVAARDVAPAPAVRTAPPADRTAPPHQTDGLVTLVDDETVGFAFPADEVFVLLAEVADEIGDVTYIDPDAGLLEVLVTPEGSGPWSVVLSLQGRADRVEAFCTVEALDGSEAQSGPVVSLLLDSLRRRLRGR